MLIVAEGSYQRVGPEAWFRQRTVAEFESTPQANDVGDLLLNVRVLRCGLDFEQQAIIGRDASGAGNSHRTRRRLARAEGESWNYQLASLLRHDFEHPAGGAGVFTINPLDRGLAIAIEDIDHGFERCEVRLAINFTLRDESYPKRFAGGRRIGFDLHFNVGRRAPEA